MGGGWLPRVPVPVLGSWTGLSLHVALSVVLVPLFVAYVLLRWPRPGRADLIGRRAVLRTLGLLAVGFAVWGAQELLTATSGSRHRFTGSREEGSFAGNAHPVTNWLSDPVPRIDPDSWELRIHGEIENETALSHEEVLALGERFVRPSSTAPAAGIQFTAGAAHQYRPCWRRPG